MTFATLCLLGVWVACLVWVAGNVSEATRMNRHIERASRLQIAEYAADRVLWELDPEFARELESAE